MSAVNILNIQVLDNPTQFTNPFQFEITFECTTPLQDDLEWKIIYVGSAEDEQYDQVLDCIMVGPVPVGVNKFVFQADAPNPSLIPPGDVTGVTVVLITCGYRGQEFIRVGYYVNNEYGDEALRLEPPSKPILERLQRNILADKPRVTRFPIKWDAVNELEPPQYMDGTGEEGMVMMGDEEMLLSGSVLEEEAMMDEDSEVDQSDDNEVSEGSEESVGSSVASTTIRTLPVVDNQNLAMDNESSPEHQRIQINQMSKHDHTSCDRTFSASYEHTSNTSDDRTFTASHEQTSDTTHDHISTTAFPTHFNN